MSCIEQKCKPVDVFRAGAGAGGGGAVVQKVSTLSTRQ